LEFATVGIVFISSASALFVELVSDFIACG
jgi:hypothetical protein